MNKQRQIIEEILNSPEIQALSKKTAKLAEVTGVGGPIQLMMKMFLEKSMEAERSEFLGYEHSDRVNKSNKNSRNGYSQKSVETSLGPTEIDIPRDREGEFSPTLLEKYKKLDPNIERKILNLYSKGLSTRDITEFIREMYGSEVSPTLISQVTNNIKDDIAAWQSRPLESTYAVIFLDAIFFKIREEGKVISKAAYTCFGVNIQGEVDILGIWIAETEGSRFWLSVLNDIKNRGVEDILIACIDGLKGFPEAIKSMFPKTEIQLCIVHQIRYSIRYVSSKDQKAFIVSLKEIYQAVSLIDAEEALKSFECKWGKQYPAAVKSWKSNWVHLSTYFKYPSEIRRMIYTTNIIENVHRQFRKVLKTKSSFPNDEALKKSLYLAIQGVLLKKRIVRNWSTIASQLFIHFEERMI